MGGAGAIIRNGVAGPQVYASDGSYIGNLISLTPPGISGQVFVVDGQSVVVDGYGYAPA